MLLRIAATGKKATPPLFETLVGLGRELVRRRVRQCVDYVKRMPSRHRHRNHQRQATPRPGALRAGDPFGVYVHFPFCSRSLSRTATSLSTRANEIPHDDYADAVIAELGARASWFEGAGPLVSIYFGGGTPGLWRPDALGRVIDAVVGDLRRSVGHAEITVEVNPGEVDEARLAALRARGVNRLSIGVQALDDRALHDPGAQPRRRGRPRLRAGGARGRVRQPLDRSDVRRAGPVGRRLAAAVDAAIALAPEHVSAYALTIERGTAFGARDRAGRLPRPDDEAVAAEFDARARRVRRRRPRPLRDLQLRARGPSRAAQPALLGARALPRPRGVGGVVPPARRRHRLAVLRTRAPPTST